MPQLDPTYFPSQIFAFVVCFLVLYFISSKMILPAITDAIARRQVKIDDDIEKATNVQKKVEKFVEENDKIIHQARGQANEIIRSESNKFSEYNREIEHDLAIKLKNHIQASEEKILVKQNEAISQMDVVATELTQMILDKLAITQFQKSDAEQIVSSMLKEQSRG
jgi:F-type H+-transporting ATPase subunit b